MGSTGDERLDGIRTIAKKFVEGILANCPYVGIKVLETTFSYSTHGLELATQGLPTPPDFIARPLHRVVLACSDCRQSLSHSSVDVLSAA